MNNEPHVIISATVTTMQERADRFSADLKALTDAFHADMKALLENEQEPELTPALVPSGGLGG